MLVPSALGVGWVGGYPFDARPKCTGVGGKGTLLMLVPSELGMGGGGGYLFDVGPKCGGGGGGVRVPFWCSSQAYSNRQT